MVKASQAARALGTAGPWPFAPLTEAQHRAQAAQACALRAQANRAHHARVAAARTALALCAAASVAACGGGGDDAPPDTPSPKVLCKTQPEVCA